MFFVKVIKFGVFLKVSGGKLTNHVNQELKSINHQ